MFSTNLEEELVADVQAFGRSRPIRLLDTPLPI